MKYGLPLPQRKQKFNELLANPQANSIMKVDVRTVNGNELFDVFRVDVELPKYRLDNTRTLAQQEQYIHDNNKKPDFFNDVESDTVQHIQHEFLKKLIESSDKAKDLLTYFAKNKNKQTDPLILTHDGFVISGNRRLCTFRTLVEEDPEKYKHFSKVRVVILPNLDADEIDQIEDFSEEQPDIKEPFSWISRAMGYRRRMQKFKYSSEDLAEKTGQKDTKIKSLLHKLEIADRYLDFIGKPKDYNEILNDDYAFEEIHTYLTKPPNDSSRKIAFEKLAFIAIKNKESFSDRMYKNIPIIFKAQATIQNEIAEEFEDEIREIEEEEEDAPVTLPGLPLFEDPVINIIKLLHNKDNEQKIIEIVSDKIEEFLVLKNEKRKKLAILEMVTKANTLLIDANNHKDSTTDKRGILSQINSIEKQIASLKDWINTK